MRAAVSQGISCVARLLGPFPLDGFGRGSRAHFGRFFGFRGYFNIGGVILTALGGSFLGDQCYFYLGRFQGPLLLKLFTTIARKFRKGLALIEKYGTFVAFASRYTYG